MLPRLNTQDALIAGAIAVWGLAEVASGAVSGATTVDVVCALLGAVPLAWRRAAPGTVGLVCAGTIGFRGALGLPVDGLALLVAALIGAYSVGRHRPTVAAAATTASMVLLTWVGLFGLPERGAYDYVFGALWLSGPALAGGTLRVQVHRAEQAAAQAARAEAEREEHARLAMQVERGRIARELHDTVAHSVSVMVLHSGAVRSRLPERLVAERDALARAEDAGRRAIAELRRLLGVLRSDGGFVDVEPQPTLAQLDELVESVRQHGLEVDLRIDGEPRVLEPGLEVSAYRIIQEALTNVRKHARAKVASVNVSYDDDALRLRVCDDGVGRTEPLGASGYGLLGIRERVEVYGGTLTVASPVDGGFQIDAAMPVRP